VNLSLMLMCIQLQLHALYIDHLFVGKNLTPCVARAMFWNTVLSEYISVLPVLPCYSVACYSSCLSISIALYYLVV